MSHLETGHTCHRWDRLVGGNRRDCGHAPGLRYIRYAIPDSEGRRYLFRTRVKLVTGAVWRIRFIAQGTLPKDYGSAGGKPEWRLGPVASGADAATWLTVELVMDQMAVDPNAAYYVDFKCDTGTPGGTLHVDYVELFQIAPFDEDYLRDTDRVSLIQLAL